MLISIIVDMITLSLLVIHPLATYSFVPSPSSYVHHSGLSNFARRSHGYCKTCFNGSNTILRNLSELTCHGTGSKRIHSFSYLNPKSKLFGKVDDCNEGERNVKNDLGEEDIRQLYLRAKEEDKEWYNTFVRDVLGEDEDYLVVAEDAKDEDCSGKKDEKSALINSNEDIVQEYNHDIIKSEIKNKLAANEGNTNDDRKDKSNDLHNSGNRSKEDKPKEEKIKEGKTNISPLSISKEDKNMIQDEKRKDSENSQTFKEQQPNLKQQKQEEKKQEPLQQQSQSPQNSKQQQQQQQEDIVARYKDVYGDIREVPLNEISKLGYIPAEIIKMKSDALDLVMVDGIRKPKKGVPQRWNVNVSLNDDKGGEYPREVQLLRRRKRQKNNNKVEIEDQSQDSPRSRMRRRDISTTSMDFEEDLGRIPRRDRNQRQYEMDDIPRQRRRPRSPTSPSNKSRQRGREIPIPDRNIDTGFWMDLPTFDKYLRREAEFRLAILGRDWEDWVRGETDWRYNLYKDWLDALNDGVGNDMFDEMNYVPPSERRGLNIVTDRSDELFTSKQKPPRRRRTRRDDPPRRRRPRNDYEEDNYSYDDLESRGIDRRTKRGNERSRPIANRPERMSSPRNTNKYHANGDKNGRTGRMNDDGDEDDYYNDNSKYDNFDALNRSRGMYRNTEERFDRKYNDDIDSSRRRSNRGPSPRPSRLYDDDMEDSYNNKSSGINAPATVERTKKVQDSDEDQDVGDIGNP